MPRAALTRETVTFGTVSHGVFDRCLCQPESSNENTATGAGAQRQMVVSKKTGVQ